MLALINSELLNSGIAQLCPRVCPEDSKFSKSYLAKIYDLNMDLQSQPDFLNHFHNQNCTAVTQLNHLVIQVRQQVKFSLHAAW